MQSSTLIVVALLAASGGAIASTAVRPHRPAAKGYDGAPAPGSSGTGSSDPPRRTPQSSSSSKKKTSIDRRRDEQQHEGENNLIGVPPVRLPSGETYHPELEPRRSPDRHHHRSQSHSPSDRSRRRGGGGHTGKRTVFVRDDEEPRRHQQPRRADNTSNEDDGDYENEKEDIPSLCDRVETPLVHGVRGLLRVPCRLYFESEYDHDETRNQYRRALEGEGDGEGGKGGSYRKTEPPSEPRGTSLAAYVDTGAQVTVISAAAARRAGLLHLLDRRYAGKATGVGHCRILGRIPAGHARVVLGDDNGGEGGNGSSSAAKTTVTVRSPQLTVLESTGTDGIDVLLGLDVLDEWNANICFRERALTMEADESSSSSSSPQRRFGVWSNGEKKRRAGAKKRRVVIPFARDGAERIREDSRISTPSSTPRIEKESSSSRRRSASALDRTSSSAKSNQERGRRTAFMDDDLKADLEWLEQESSSGSSASLSDGGYGLSDGGATAYDAEEAVHNDDYDVYSDDLVEEEEDMDADFDMSGV